MRSRFNMSLVSGVSGRLITRRSADGSSKSSSDTFFTASNAGSSHIPLLDTPIMHSGSNALALLAKEHPMSPVPSTSILQSLRDFCSTGLLQLPLSDSL